jgi:sugar transferase EpsL
MKNRQVLQPSERSRRWPGKRLLDLVLLLMTLPLVVPVLLLLTLAVRCMIGSPILFRQQRPGLYGAPFTILKFRTMTNTRDEAGQLLPDSQRLTRFGRFLRATSLDELPELLNVLRGDMSLVGPRPLLMEYLERYTPELQRRHHVLPGITGWAQLNGRNTTTWERRFALDLWYVDHHSLGLDLQILLLTPWKVIKREGVMHPDSPSWEEEFEGLSSKRPPQAARELSAFREEGK